MFKTIKRMMKDDELSYKESVDRYADQIDEAKDIKEDWR